MAGCRRPKRISKIPKGEARWRRKTQVEFILHASRLIDRRVTDGRLNTTPVHYPTNVVRPIRALSDFHNFRFSLCVLRTAPRVRRAYTGDTDVVS